MYLIREKENIFLMVFLDVMVENFGLKPHFLSFYFTVLEFQFPTQPDIFSWKTKFILNRTVKM